MTISDKSIIEPEAHKPGIPIKKTTLGVIALLICAAAFVTAILTDTGHDTTRPQPTAEKKPDGSNDESGSKVVIDEELKAAKEAVADHERKTSGTPPQPIVKAATSQGPSTPASPLPADVRRSDQAAAVYEKSFAKNGGARTPGTKAAEAGGNSREDIEFESDVLARGSKVVAFDDGGSGGGYAVSSLMDGFGGATGRSASGARVIPNVTPAVATAPSAAIQPKLDSIAAAYRAQSQSGGVQTRSPAAGNSSWLNEYAGNDRAKTNDSIKSYATASRYTLHQGKVIPAVLGRAINSDLPGEITAYTTTDVYDSMGNGALLIPKGSVLVGRYNSELKMGQERVLFAFNRIILPDGNSFDLPSAQGMDMGGASGMEGDVNNHFIKMFAASFFTAWLADRVTPQSQTSGLGGVTTTVSPAGQVLVDVSRTILDRNKTIQPTITVEKGARINVDVKKDMEFAGPYNRSRN